MAVIDCVPLLLPVLFVMTSEGGGELGGASVKPTRTAAWQLVSGHAARVTKAGKAGGPVQSLRHL